MCLRTCVYEHLCGRCRAARFAPRLSNWRPDEDESAVSGVRKGVRTGVRETFVAFHIYIDVFIYIYIYIYV